MSGLLLSLTAWAFAANADDLADAKKHFETGTSLYREARYREAITEFELAIQLSMTAKPEAAGVAHFNLAQTHEKLGDVGAALKSYREYLRLVPRAEDRARVQTIVANLEQRLARGVQDLTIASDPSGAAVTVDDKPRGVTPLTLELPYGTHQVKVAHPGYELVIRSLELTPQASVRLDLSLSKVAPQEKSRLWTWVALGAAAAAAGGGIYFGVQASRNAEELRASQHGQADADRLYDSASQSQLLANVLYGTAGAAAVAGGALFFVEGSF
jgi:tetratricopeptide (TPR) repeat protein